MCGLTSVRIISVIVTKGIALLLPLGVAFLSDLGLPYARTLEIAHYEGLLIWITPESYNADILRSHFVRYNTSIKNERLTLTSSQLIAAIVGTFFQIKV